MTPKTAIFKRVGIKTLLCALIALILALVLHSVASADYSQTNDADIEVITRSTNNENMLVQTLGTGLSGTLTRFKITMAVVSLGEYDEIYLTEATSGDPATLYGATPGFFDSGCLEMATDKTYYDFEIPPYELDPEKYYGIVIVRCGGWENTKVWGSVENNYANGQCYESWNGTDFFNCDTLQDIYFVLETELQNSIEIIYPENSTSTPYVFVWRVAGGFTNTPPGHIQINVGETPDAFTKYAGGFILDNTGEFDWNVLNPSVLKQNTTYYAKAWLQLCLGFADPYAYYNTCIPSTWDNPENPTGYFTNIASSTVITFTTTGEGIESPYYFSYYPEITPTSTATSTEWVLTCDPNDPLWQRSICQIAKWIIDGVLGVIKYLFVPNPVNLSKFANLDISIKTKAPVGYFYAVKDALGNVGSTSTKAFDLATSTVAIEPVLTPIKTGASFLLWFVFGFWTFNRIRNLDL